VEHIIKKGLLIVLKLEGISMCLQVSLQMMRTRVLKMSVIIGMISGKYVRLMIQNTFRLSISGLMLPYSLGTKKEINIAFMQVIVRALVTTLISRYVTTNVVLNLKVE
jgi:hypothetical protein